MPICDFTGIEQTILETKLDANVERDKRTHAKPTLKKSGWRVFVLWECQINDKNLALTGKENFMQNMMTGKGSETQPFLRRAGFIGVEFGGIGSSKVGRFFLI